MKRGPRQSKDCLGQQPHAASAARAQWRVTICPGLPGKSIQWKGAPRQSADCLGQQPHAASAARTQWRVMICPGLPGKSIQWKRGPQAVRRLPGEPRGEIGAF